MDPGNQETRREKVTQPSWAGSEPARARSVHCRRAPRSRQTLTIKIERSDRRRRDPSSVSQADSNPAGSSRQAGAEASQVMEGEQTTTHQSLAAFPPARMQLLGLWTPREVWHRTLRRVSGSASSLVAFSSLRASRPGLIRPRVQGRQGRGRLGTRLGSGGKKRSLFGVEGTAEETISIPHQLLPATNQPSQGAVSV